MGIVINDILVTDRSHKTWKIKYLSETHMERQTQTQRQRELFNSYDGMEGRGHWGGLLPLSKWSDLTAFPSPGLGSQVVAATVTFTDAFLKPWASIGQHGYGEAANMGFSVGYAFTAPWDLVSCLSLSTLSSCSPVRAICSVFFLQCLTPCEWQITAQYMCSVQLLLE